MTAADILERLRGKDIHLRLEEGKLRVNAPAGAVTPELRALVERHRDELITLLTAPPTGSVALAAKEAGDDSTLSFAQERIWFLCRLEPESPVYNIPLGLIMRGPLRLECLRGALQEIYNRHDALRTVFREIDGMPTQQVLPSGDIPFVLHDYSRFSPLEREAACRREAEECATRPFDLAVGPLVRIEVLRRSEEDHLLVLVFHHAISDGWSIIQFAGELSSGYSALVAGRRPACPPIPAQYVQFSRWQREHVRSPQVRAQLEYWRDRLSGELPLLTLPSDRPRPAVMRSVGAMLHRPVPPDLARSLRALGARYRVTPFMTLLAGFNVLLAKCSGQEDVLVGTPVAYRTRSEFEQMIGCFINTVVLRTGVSAAMTVGQLLESVRNTTLDAFANQDVPFEQIVEAIHPDRSLSHNPMFQVLFSLTAPQRPLEFSGLTTEAVPLATSTAKFDLSLFVEDEGEGFSLAIEYNSDLFDASTVARLVRYYFLILQQFVERPDAPVASLELLGGAEREQVLREWNATARTWEGPGCIHTLFERTAESMPDAAAVIDRTTRISYRALNTRAEEIAGALIAAGVGEGDLVGVSLPRTWELIAALLGVLKTGAAYVAVDPAYPRERQEYIVDDARVRVLLGSRAQAEAFPATSVRTLTLEEIPAGKGGISPAPRREHQSDALAYVIYTSGSTGRPKGVAIEHRNAVNLIHWGSSVYSRDDLACVLGSTSINFDLSIFEMFVPLSIGGCVAIAGNALELPSLPSAAAVTLVNTVPSSAASLLETGGFPRGVRVINLAGEPLSQTLVDALYAKTGVERVYDLYGPSETTTYSTFALRERGGRATIGRPIANTSVYLLDAGGRPVPVGVTGEVFIGGAGVVRGYLGRPELTAERFLEDPFVPGGRMYRTGDLARFFPSGEIEFLGRRDNQVKVRGFRIELGEVEERIRHHPGVADCAVVVRDDPGGGKSLEAFVAFAEPPPPGKNADDRGNDVMRDLRDRLPGYMVPGRVVVLERLPRTPNGKLDRHALPSGPHRTAAGGEEATAARDPLEMQLVHVWERMFGVSPIGVHDNFFGLGGHSLLAVRLFHEIEQLTGKRMPLATLFQAPTVARLAEVLRHDGWVAPWSSLVSIQPGGSKPPFFGVHGVGGNILEFIDLARYVGTDQPFYGIQAQGLDGSRPRHTSVQEMATHYLKEIREFQPQGPYYIGGSSFGGLVALEMAQQLTAAGERVALLAMFDTNAPGYPRYLPTSTAWKRRLNWWRFRIDLHWSNFVAAGAGEKVQYIREKSSRLAKAQRKKVKRLYRRMRRKIQNRLLPKQILNVQRSGVQALRTYLPSPYGGKITLFRATVQPFGIHHDRTNGWEPFARGELEIIDVPGHHGAIMREPRVKALAEELVHALERARKQEEHAPVPLPQASSVSTTSTGE